MRWKRSTDGGSTGTDIAGATSSTYTIAIVPLSHNGDQLQAVFTNSGGSATADPVTITIQPASPPNTSVLLPSNGATIISGTWLDASAWSPSGIGIARVVFEVSANGLHNLVVSGSGATSYGYIGAWDSSDGANGTYHRPERGHRRLGPVDDGRLRHRHCAEPSAPHRGPRPHERRHLASP